MRLAVGKHYRHRRMLDVCLRVDRLGYLPSQYMVTWWNVRSDPAFPILPDTIALAEDAEGWVEHPAAPDKYGALRPASVAGA